MFYTKSMEQDPGNKKFENNKWDILREPEFKDRTEETPEKKRERTDAEKARIAERVLSAEETAILARDYFERAKAEAPTRAKEYISNMLDTETAFRKQVKRAQGRGENHISRKEFEIWEDDYESDWKHAHEEMRRGDIVSSEAEAEIESALMLSDGDALNDTIEAQAGHFYFERSKALDDAIRASDDPKRNEDLAKLGSFLSSVQEHLNYKYMDMRGSDAWEFESYDRKRTKAHNDLIRHLNSLNDLARKYGVRPFTMRNFWTSEKSLRSDPEPVKQRMRHDRHQVEAYCRNAFTRLHESAKRQAERRSFF